MIHDEICTYEVCMLAKEKGFPQDPKENNTDQIYCWDNLRKIHTLCSCAMWYIGEYNREDMFAAPTQSLLQRWLREEKGTIIEVIAQPTRSTSKKNCYWWVTKQNSSGFGYQYEECSYFFLYDNGGYFSTYELALEDALKYILQNLV